MNVEKTLAQNLRIRLDLRYHGRFFHGWAAQPGLRTVEGELVKALMQICRAAVTLTVAGRTDAGVHAREQVAHFDLPRTVWEKLPGRSQLLPEQAIVRKINAVLSHNAPKPKEYSDCVVYSAQVVSQSFDARFSALWRMYNYQIADGAANWDPMRTDVLWVPQELDLSAMNEAALPLLGEHDFLSYCKPRLGASTVRTLQELNFRRVEDAAGNSFILARVKADAFCHSQVRTLVGTLLEVGRGARPTDWPAKRLAARLRNGEVIVAPAHGLTLAKIGYPPPTEWAAQALRARRFRGVELGQDEADCGCTDA
ncbi:tRNA pseudouridine(38-40) synthase TruA [Arcanobacterium hippocoleae]|uniref:tRNA pseudouridine(38-40) synthase TruA n=1 Tax=Arcanobacterium hippocoleae TaxID=149017 RepID=UPI00366E1C9E